MMQSSNRRQPATTRRTPDSNREDLLRQATALRRRAELVAPGEPERVLAGFRADGAWSIYFGSDPVYHFDAAGRLRRAFVGGDLYRTQGTTLARLSRVRTPDVTELRRHDLDEHELAAYLRAMRERLERLRAALQGGAVVVVRHVPAEDVAFLGDLRATLESSLNVGAPLAAPIKGRR